MWALTYLGHVIDAFYTKEEAEEGRRNLVHLIKSGNLPNFLDADDITGVSDFDTHYDEDVC